MMGHLGTECTALENPDSAANSTFGCQAPPLLSSSSSAAEVQGFTSLAAAASDIELRVMLVMMWHLQCC
jgi:hypothetical protein